MSTITGVMGAPTWSGGRQWVTLSWIETASRNESTPIHDQLQAEFVERRIARLVRARDARGRFAKP
jgi:hypothetical protein